MQPVRGGEIVYPEPERLVPELDRAVEHAVEGEKDGNLKRHRQASAHRVDLVGLVDLHEFLVQLFPIIFEFLTDLLRSWAESFFIFCIEV